MADKVTRDNVETRLREAELRLTPQRFAVLEYLTRAGGHPTADQIAAEINRRFPRASRATVYNALKALRDAGRVQSAGARRARGRSRGGGRRGRAARPLRRVRAQGVSRAGARGGRADFF